MKKSFVTGMSYEQSKQLVVTFFGLSCPRHVETACFSLRNILSLIPPSAK